MIDLIREMMSSGIKITINAEISITRDTKGKHHVACQLCEWDGHYATRSGANRALQNHMKAAHDAVKTDQDSTDDNPPDWIIELDHEKQS